MFDTHTGRGINSNLDYANQQLAEEWQKLFLKNKVHWQHLRCRLFWNAVNKQIS